MQPVSIEAPSPKLLNELRGVIAEIETKEGQFESFEALFRKPGANFRRPLIVYDVGNQEFLFQGGPPLRSDEKDLLKQFVSQGNTIDLKKGPLKVVGPVIFNFNQKPYALFMRQPMDMGGGPERLLLWLIPIAVAISVIFCWLFATSIVRPIRHLQNTGRELADGNWEARNDLKAFGRDEIAELALDFNRMAEQLQRMWHGQKRLLGDISHELRSPLARMQMAIGLAHQQDAGIPTLDRIEREAVRMETLINQLLQLTRAETGKPSFSSVDLHEVLAELFQDAAFEATTAGKHFFGAEIPHVSFKANPLQLQSAVENVLRNAIRYAQSQVTAQFAVTETFWQLSICDDGPGLDSDECDEIFKPFYRPSTSRERQSGGVGLGLAIAQAAVDMHGGNIKAEPRDSGGLKVTITVPLRDE